ncbi:MAG TPA: APC family permease, partial [Actinomycetota bacterium]|nr:APC family permease [Actinomycetota bacterium]
MATAEREREREGAGTETTVDLIKRIVVGRRMPSHRLEHTLLPKVLALPVFSSDALSSVAYATEQILVVLVAASLASAHRLVMPISIAIAALMAIVVASYRQTVRAYPSGGGAYIVSKDNLGTFPGLVAAAALLTDYVLTVSVSVVAGVFAITSALPSLNPHKVLLSIAFIGLITLANLRGVRESGILFAVPTYGFILSIYVLVATGLVKCATRGCPAAVLPPHGELLPIGVASTVGLFVVLHAFSSGSTALTGVEAISNGVPAFRRPQARNAAQTLAIMGVIAITMFLGISYLASRAHPLPSEFKSVVAQVADGVFHHGFMYYLVQVFTAAILVLAANTSFQDFPRLSSILARDRFLPRQFENRGDRLVFSNGVIVLAIMASILIWVFQANLDRLIQLYVVGVFTSFTLSQSGMVRHWHKVSRRGGDQAKGWRRSIVINGVGAVATGLVLAIVVETKFLHGAWIVIAAMPVIISAFYGTHRHYESISRQLRVGGAQITETPINTVVLYVEELNEATAEAVGYVRSFAGRDFHAIHVRAHSTPADFGALWKQFSRTDVELDILAPGPHATTPVVDYIRALPRAEGDFVTVVIPELLRSRSLLSAVRRGTTFFLKVRLLSEPEVVVTDVPVVKSPNDDDTPRGSLIPARTVALVFVSGVNDAVVRAVNYARSLKATETRAVFFAFEPQQIDDIQAGWAERHIPVSLDIVEAPFRDLTGPVLEEVRRVTARRGS